MSRQTVLAIGSSGNIGLSVIIAALRSDRNVLAVVRSKTSQDKVLHQLSFDKSLPTDRVTFAEADVASDTGVEGVVEKVKAGKLPAFQHVYSAVGVYEPKTPIHTVDTATLRRVMNTGFESNFFAYRATIPYLLSLPTTDPNPTWTLVTGGAGEHGVAGVTATSQGALFSLATVACRELADTPIRFNEVYLHYRVDYDLVCDENPTLGGPKAPKRMRASEFAGVYERILGDEGLKGGRVSVGGFEDLGELKWRAKVPGGNPGDGGRGGKDEGKVSEGWKGGDKADSY